MTYHKNGSDKRLSMLVILLSVSIFFSGCSLFKKDTKDIEEAVDNYFEELTDGTLVEEDYESDYADDAPFAEIYFEDDTVIPVMHKVLELVEYEIGEVDGSEKEEEATCEVILTAPDIEEIIDSLDEGFTVEELEDALTDKKAPTEEHEIELELEYDDEWIILDTSEIAEILAEPFEDITFGPNVSGAESARDEYLVAIATGDVDTLDRIGDYYDSSLVYGYDGYQFDLIISYFEFVSFEWTGEPDAYDDFVYFYGTMTYPDTQSIVNDIAEDSDFMVSAYKAALLNYLDDYYYYGIEESVLASIQEEMVNYFADSSYQVSDSVEIDMYFDPNNEQWLVSWFPSWIYSIASAPDNTDIYVEDTILSAADGLLAEGSIDQDEYDEILYNVLGISPTEVTDPDVTDPDVTDVTVDALQASLDEVVFYSWDMEEYVDSFVAAETTQIATDIYFYDDFTGTSLYYELYFNDSLIDYQTVPVEEYTVGASCAFFDFPISVGSWTFEPGTYNAIIYTTDGQIVAESSFEMT